LELSKEVVMAILGTMGFVDSASITTNSSDHALYSSAADVVLGAEGVAAIGTVALGPASFGYTFDVLLCAKFRQQAELWKDETIHISSLTEMENHRAYQEIIGMGQPVVPLILQELVNDPDWWFMALDALVDAPPSLEEANGNLIKLSTKWIEWGKSNGHLPVTR
jgi:hypothetical protein